VLWLAGLPAATSPDIPSIGDATGSRDARSVVGVVYGLVAAVAFGLSDFVVTRTARRRGVLGVFFSMQAIGLLVVGLAVLSSEPLPTAPAETWLLMVTAAAVNCAGTVLLYRAFAVGTLAVVSPIASGFAVVTGLLALATGERLPMPPLIGAVLLVAGVVVVAATGGGHARRASSAGMIEALGAAVGIGVYFWALSSITPVLGWLWPVVATRAVQLLGAGLAALGMRRQPVVLDRSSVPWVVAAALLETTALVAFNLGLAATYVSTTTALTSLYSAVAAILAWLFLRERLAPAQYLGIGVILGGVLLVSL
jgi:drug/metabolite transporter (DMT)-like permease